MITINPIEVSVPKMHGLLLDAVAPRPIAFASTVDKEGKVNLSPFSFFNVFSANPPILIFSPARRGRDNSVKHTYENILEVPEVVINMVNYSIVHQASLASSEFPKGINEFLKSGLTEEKSVRIRPPRVKESPVSFECKVNQVVPLGDQGGAGNLIICEVLLMHIKEEILDNDGRINPWKLDAVARMGRDYYCRVQGENIFELPKPGDKIKIGIDQLPAVIRESKLFSMQDLAVLGSVEGLPYQGKVPVTFGNELFQLLAKEKLERGDADGAWRILMGNENS
jgi:flavin reductase (DIM6/NTAB) family NADH-FMN oxidoreductase RutF